MIVLEVLGVGVGGTAADQLINSTGEKISSVGQQITAMQQFSNYAYKSIVAGLRGVWGG